LNDSDAENILITAVNDIRFKDYGFPVVYQTQTLDRTGTYIEIEFIRKGSEKKELGRDGFNKWSGIMQLNICVVTSDSVNSTESMATNDNINIIYNKIYDTFKGGTYINGVRIVKTYKNTGRKINDDTFVVPVSVVWNAFMEN
jgi:hypothetical protein